METTYMNTTYKLLFLFFFFFMIICLVPVAGDTEPDPFGDPFDQAETGIQTEEEETNTEFEEPPAADTLREILFSWETGYYPLARFIPGEKPLFVSNRVTGKADVSCSFGNVNIQGSFDLDINPRDINLSGADSVHSLRVNELYCGIRGDFFDVKAGYFPVEWSQMNTFHLTNYFNTREGLSTDLDQFGFDPDEFDFVVDYSRFTDEGKDIDPVCGIHLLGYYSMFSLELIISPPFFFYDQAPSMSEAIDTIPFPPTVEVTLDNTLPAFSLENTEIAARAGITISSLDFYLSYFHGFDNRLLYTTATTVSLPADIDILMTKEYSLLDRIGSSLSYDLSGMIIHAEMVMSFAEPIVYSETTTYPDPLGDITDTKSEKTAAMEISAGFDWEVLSGFRVIAEYTDFFLLEDVADVQEEILHGDSTFGALHYTLPLSQGEITLKTGVLFDWAGNELTSVSSVNYDFLNGFNCEVLLYYFYITEETDATSDIFKILDKSILAGIFFTLSL
jgi:hypothetical protein